MSYTRGKTGWDGAGAGQRQAKAEGWEDHVASQRNEHGWLEVVDACVRSFVLQFPTLGDVRSSDQRFPAVLIKP
jgi:hypothetical protein